MKSIRRGHVAGRLRRPAAIRFGLALAATGAAVVGAAAATFSARPPDHPIPACPAATAEVVPVRAVVESEPGEAEEERRLEELVPPLTEPGALFRGGQLLPGPRISHLLVGESIVAAPWRAKRDHGHLLYDCLAGDAAPLLVEDSVEHWGNHSYDSHDCYYVPSWVVSRGLALGEDDFLFVAHSEHVVSESGLWFRGPSREVDARLVLARGPEPFWRFATLLGTADRAPAPRLEGDDLLLCLEDGFYRVRLDTMAATPFERWPRRPMARPRPSWCWLLVLAALAACVAVDLVRIRAAREATRQLLGGAPEEALVSAVTAESLELRRPGGQPLELPWQRVVDAYRGPGGVCLLVDPEQGPLPRGTARGVTWDASRARVGHRVSLVLGAAPAGSGPYRSLVSPPELRAWVLHSRVTVRDAVAAVRSAALPRLGTLLALAIALAAAVATLAELWL